MRTPVDNGVASTQGITRVFDIENPAIMTNPTGPYSYSINNKRVVVESTVGTVRVSRSAVMMSFVPYS